MFKMIDSTKIGKKKQYSANVLMHSYLFVLFFIFICETNAMSAKGITPFVECRQSTTINADNPCNIDVGTSDERLIEKNCLSASQIVTWFSTHHLAKVKNFLNIYVCKLAQGEKEKTAVEYPKGIKHYLSDNAFEKIDCQIDTSIVPQNNYTILAPGGKIGDYTDTFRIDSFPIIVKNLPKTIDSKFGLAKICINISHRRASDLKVELLSPDGSSIWLTNRNGGDEGINYVSTCFRSNGFNGYIHQGEAPFTGEYIPDGRLEFLNNGQNPNGTWHLLIRDLRSNQTGQLHLASLDFEENPMPNLGTSPCNFENPAACQCANQLNENCELLPDLIILEKFTKKQIKEYSCDDPFYPGQLRFAATIANVGDGPMETIGKDEWTCGNKKADVSTPCPDGTYPRQKIYQRIYHLEKEEMTFQDEEAGTNYYDAQPGHDHYHVDNWVEFRLVKKQINSEGKLISRLVSKANKVSYCLWDTGACNNSDGLCHWGDVTFGQSNLTNYGLGNYTSCKSEKQGISVGGYDTYGMMYEGQYLDLPRGLAAGEYFLEIEIDPNNLYKEKSKKNNIFSMPIQIKKQKC